MVFAPAYAGESDVLHHNALLSSTIFVHRQNISQKPFTLPYDASSDLWVMTRCTPGGCRGICLRGQAFFLRSNLTKLNMFDIIYSRCLLSH